MHDQFQCTCFIFVFSLYWHIVRKSISWCYSVKRSPLYLVSVPADPPIQDPRSSHSLFHPEDDFYPQAGLNQKTDFSLRSWAEPPPQWPSSISIKNWSSVFEDVIELLSPNVANWRQKEDASYVSPQCSQT